MMLTSGCILLYAFMHTLTVSSEVIRYNSKGILNPTFTDRRIEETYIDSNLVGSKLSCYTICRNMANCFSVQYNGVMNKCVLFDRDFTDVDSTQSVAETGWLYYYVIKDYPVPKDVSACASYSGLWKVICVGFCFHVNGTVMTHTDASVSCHQKGGELARIDRELKQRCLTNMLDEYLSSLTNPYPYTHIQGSRESYTSPWFYDNGDKITYFNWNQVTHQPDNNPGENWIIVNSRDNCAWHDRLNVELRSVCQLHGQV